MSVNNSGKTSFPSRADHPGVCPLGGWRVSEHSHGLESSSERSRLEGRLTPKPSSPSPPGPACVPTLTPGQLEGLKALGGGPTFPPSLPTSRGDSAQAATCGGVEPRPRLSGTTHGPRCSGGTNVGLTTLFSCWIVKLNFFSFHLKNQGGR